MLHSIAVAQLGTTPQSHFRTWLVLQANECSAKRTSMKDVRKIDLPLHCPLLSALAQPLLPPLCGRPHLDLGILNMNLQDARSLLPAVPLCAHRVCYRVHVAVCHLSTSVPLLLCHSMRKESLLTHLQSQR